MKDYISETEHYLYIRAQFDRLDSFPWKEIATDKLDTLPNAAGIFVFFKHRSDNPQITYIGTSSSLRDYIPKLLKSGDSRCTAVSVIQYALESDYSERFFGRSDFKNLLEKANTPLDKIANVLKDDDPRILERNRKIQQSITEQIYR